MEATTTRKITAEYLAECLTRANAAALAVAGTPDGGTCNLDSPILKLPHVGQTVVDEAVKLSGVEVGEPFRGGWHSGYRFVRTASDGQAARRSAMAHAAFKSLQADGLQASEWLHAD